MSEQRALLGDRGRDIWDAFQADNLAAGHRALVHEAARLADTLDRLSRVAAGDKSTWLHLALDEMGEVTLALDSVLSEIRNQQTVFKNLMLEIRQAGLVQNNPNVKAKDEIADVDESDVVVKFQRRVADRTAG